MRQDDLVAFKGARVTQATRVQVYDVQRVVLQRRAWIRGHRLVVAVHLEEMRMRLLGQISSRADDHVPAVVGEQTAFSIQVLAVRGHVGDVEKGEEAFEEFTSDIEGPLVVPVRQGLALLALKEVFRGLASLVFVDLKGSLIGGEGDETAPVGGELTEEAGGLLYIHHGEIGEEVLVEAAHAVPVSPEGARADPTSLQAVDDVLVLNATRLQSWEIILWCCGVVRSHNSINTAKTHSKTYECHFFSK